MVTLLHGDIVQCTLMGIGDGHNALSCLGLAVLLLQVSLNDAESHSRLRRGTRLGNHSHGIVLTLQQLHQLTIIILAQRMACIHH